PRELRLGDAGLGQIFLDEVHAAKCTSRAIALAIDATYSCGYGWIAPQSGARRCLNTTGRLATAHLYERSTMDTRHSKAARAARLKSRRSPAPKRRRAARRKHPKPTPTVAVEPVSEPIQEAIEVERGRLYEAETLLLCTVAAMEGGGEED